MKSIIQVANPPSKPLLIYDGECQFCTFWVLRWHRSGSGRMDVIPFQDPQFIQRFPEISRQDLEAALHLIDSDGSVYRAAEATFRALSTNPRQYPWLKLYSSAPLFAHLAEACYRFVAQHRAFFSALTKKLFAEEFAGPR